MNNAKSYLSDADCNAEMVVLVPSQLNWLAKFHGTQDACGERAATNSSTIGSAADEDPIKIVGLVATVNDLPDKR